MSSKNNEINIKCNSPTVLDISEGESFLYNEECENMVNGLKVPLIQSSLLIYIKI